MYLSNILWQSPFIGQSYLNASFAVFYQSAGAFT